MEGWLSLEEAIARASDPAKTRVVPPRGRDS